MGLTRSPLRHSAINLSLRSEFNSTTFPGELTENLGSAQGALAFWECEQQLVCRDIEATSSYCVICCKGEMKER